MASVYCPQHSSIQTCNKVGTSIGIKMVSVSKSNTYQTTSIYSSLDKTLSSMTTFLHALWIVLKFAVEWKQHIFDGQLP